MSTKAVYRRVVSIAAISLALAASLLQAKAQSAAPPVAAPPVAAPPPTVLITGASRGIGFEFARQYAEAGWNVIATARKPAESKGLSEIATRYRNLRIEQLDVIDGERQDPAVVARAFLRSKSLIP